MIRLVRDRCAIELIWKFKMKKKIIIVLFILILIGIGYSYFYNEKSDIVYLTEPVQRGNISQQVIATGTVRSANRVEVGARVSGQVQKIYVKVGQKVKKGELLAQLDSVSQEDSLKSSEAQLKALQALLSAYQVELTANQSNYKRVAQLYAKKSVSLSEYEQANTALAAVQAKIAQVQTQIEQGELEVNAARTRLDYTKIVSPIDGTVIAIPVSEGQTVNANQYTPTIVQVADLNTMLIKPEIAEGDITKIAVGMPVHFTTLSDPKRVYHSKIESIDPATTTLVDNEYSESVSDNSAVYYYANVLIDNADGKLRIGMTTQDTIVIASVQDVLLVPNLAVSRNGSTFTVRVLTEKNEVIEKTVEVGLKDDTNTEIKSGLTEGEKVITAELSDGETVGTQTRRPRIM